MDSLQSIAAYCRGELKGETLRQFEERLESDVAFAAEVADYQHTETIGKYLNGELEGEELKVFEVQLAEDKELTAEVKEYEDDSLYQNLTSDLQILGKQLELEETLKELSESYKKDMELNPLKVASKQTPSDTAKPDKKPSIFSKHLWIVIPAIAAVLTMVFLFPQLFSPSSPETLYASYLEKDKIANFTTKGDTDLLSKSEVAFRSEKYEVAIELLEQVEFQDDKVKIALGVAYLENKPSQTGKGIEIFQTMENDIDKNWYLALAYLKQNKVAKAKESLKKVEKAGGSRSSKALELLKKLEN